MATELQIFKNGVMVGTRSLEDGVYRIGREATADIVLADGAVSKTHAMLTIDRNRLIIKDAGSANGLFCNGKKITEQAVKNRLHIDIKPFTLRTADAGTPAAEGRAGRFWRRLQAAGLANIKASGFVLVFVIMVLTLLIGYLPLKSQSADALRRERLKTGVLLGRYLAEMNRPFLSDNNRAMVRTAPVSEEDGVVYAVVVDADGRIIAPPEKQGDFFKWDGLAQAFKDGKLTIAEGLQREKIIFYPVRRQSQTLGAAIVGFAGDQAAGGGIGMGGAGYFLLAVLFGLSLLAARLLARAFLGPLVSLNEQVEIAIKEGRSALDFQAPYEALDHLKRSFDRLLIRKPAASQETRDPLPKPAAARTPGPATVLDPGAPSVETPAASTPPRAGDLIAPWCAIDRETYTIQNMSPDLNAFLGEPVRREGMHVIEAFEADLIQPVSQLMEAEGQENQTVALQGRTCRLTRMTDPDHHNLVILMFEDTPS